MNKINFSFFASLCVVSLYISAFSVAEEPVIVKEAEMVALSAQETIDLPDEEATPEAFPEFACSEESTRPVELEEGIIGDLAEEVVFFADAPYLYRIHNDAFYHIAGYSDTGSVIQMHDASKWDVHPRQQSQVIGETIGLNRGWLTNDDIFIKPRSSCFSSYGYVMHNITKGEAIEVNLRTPPLPMGAYTFRILNIEPYLKRVHLSDGTVWQVNQNDRNFPHWQIGQRIIIGVNNNWKTAEMPHILINVDLYKEPYAEADYLGNAVHQ